MAVDVSSFSYFSPIFTFLFIWIVLYALLKKMEWFGKNDAVITTISFLSSMMFLMVPETTEIVGFATPWVFLLGVLIVLAMILFMFMGVKEDAVTKIVSTNPILLTIIFVVLGIIFLVSLTNVFGNFLLPGTTGGFWDVTKRVLFHPRTLGMLFLLVVVSYAIRFLTAER
ncbi:MAG: hypothetical protein Q8R00_03735 [Candidatus Nanoarchaeia archaeon]|nr:hypothetical protein [Candidatus Nanoarchaeia archaeon]